MLNLAMCPDALDILHEAADVDHIHPYNPDDLIDRIAGYDAFWGHFDTKVSRAVLEKGAGQLKAVYTATTGTDHIDKAAAKELGIRVLCHAKDIGLLESFSATAECAWMHLMVCMRNYRPAIQHAFEGGWGNSAFMGRQLMGNTIGILGVGRLGKMSVDIARGFGMKILACDRIPMQIDGVEFVDFDTLLAKSDAITIHIHMTQDNYHLFNADTFAKMKPGMFIANTSRGDIVDEAAMIDALDKGIVAGYGTDVIHNEWMPDKRESPIVKYAMTHPNVSISPHLGGHTQETVGNARRYAARKLAHYLKTGEEVLWESRGKSPFA